MCKKQCVKEKGGLPQRAIKGLSKYYSSMLKNLEILKPYFYNKGI